MYSIFSLIYQERKPVPRTNVKFANVWGKTNVDALVLKPRACDDIDEVWPLLHFVKLKPRTEINENISLNLEELDLMARK